MISVQIGASCSTYLFGQVGPEGATVLRQGFSALILMVLFRPWRRLPPRADTWEQFPLVHWQPDQRLCDTGPVGVTDPQAFRQVFRRELGLTPAECRRRLRPSLCIIMMHMCHKNARLP